MNRFGPIRCFVFLAGMFCLLPVLNQECLADDSLKAKSTTAPPQQVATKQDVLAGLLAEHPRLLATKDDFLRLKHIIQVDPTAREWFKDLESDAEKLLEQMPVVYEIPDGKRLLAVSRQTKQRVLLLGLVYRITEEQKWADRLWLELDTVTKFKDWNPSHFLDTAEMTLAVSIGYDWLYDEWSEEQRTQLQQAIVNLGLQQALPFEARQNWWWRASHNWNQVCNGGMVVGCLAVADKEPELAAKLIAASVASLPLAMKEFAPDGGWGEGPGYWSYATEYNVFCLAAMRAALGHDFELSKIPGFAETGNFPMHFVGPTGLAFNYADGPAVLNWRGASQMFWLATAFEQAGWAQFQLASMKDARPKPMDLLWGARWLDQTTNSKPLPLDKIFGGIEVGFLRSDWDDPHATFIGFKGGDNRVNHGHLDLGSFVLDAEGERWIEDQGKDDYNMPNYFGKMRWNYYRLRAEANNTLVINPDGGPDQNVNATEKISEFQSKSNLASAVIDLSSAYKEHAHRVRRGFLMKDRRDVLVQDEIELKQAGEIWWFVNTSAVAKLDDAKRTVVLKKNGKTFYFKLIEPANATFQIVDAIPLPTSPNPPGQAHHSPRKNRMKKVTIHLTDVKQERISVLFSPDRESGAKAIDEW